MAEVVLFTKAQNQGDNGSSLIESSNKTTGSHVVPLTYKPNSQESIMYEQFVTCGGGESIQIALRSLSSLACVYTDRPSSMISKILDEGKHSILHWFKDTYLPRKMLNRHFLEVKDLESSESEDKVESIQVWYELAPSAQLETIDKSVCLFLNEVTGYGHLYGEEAKNQRLQVRHMIIEACIEDLRSHLSVDL